MRLMVCRRWVSLGFTCCGRTVVDQGGGGVPRAESWFRHIEPMNGLAEAPAAQ
jgi:hypothetical protein